MPDDVESLRSLLGELTRCPPDQRPQIAEAILEWLEDDMFQWWTLVHDRIRSGRCPTYRAFAEQFFVTLLPSLLQLRTDLAFPKLFMDTLEHVMQEMLDSPAPGDGRSVATAQPSEHVPRLQGIFISRTMVRWYAERLTTRRREVLELAFVRGFSLAEIGRQEGSSEGTIRTVVAHGIASIRLLASEDAGELRRRGPGRGNPG